jgi:hypothetical protein
MAYDPTAPFAPTVRLPRSLRATDQRPLCLVVHCSSREALYLPYTVGKRDRDKRPKGYRVEFAPGDTCDFDAEGRVYHQELAATRLWSMVPAGQSLEARASAERQRMGCVPSLDLAAWMVEQDRRRAEAQVAVKNAKGETIMKRKTRALMGLPPAPKAAAQVALFDVGPAVPKPRKPRAKRTTAPLAKAPP